MTTEELDKRLNQALINHAGIHSAGLLPKNAESHRRAIIDAIKPVISDCIDAVVPPAYTEDQGIDAEMASHNHALDAIQTNKRNLLGENSWQLDTRQGLHS